MNNLHLVKKLSILISLITFVLVFFLGLLTGTPWDTALIRGILMFLAVLVGCLLLFALAVMDKNDGEKKNNDKLVEDIEEIDDIE